MSAHDFFKPSEKKRITDAVRAAERQTAAEIVVSVRRISGHYGAADLAWGCVAAFLFLCLFLYHPEPFEWTFLPLELVLAGLIGGLCSWGLAPVRRLLVSRRRSEEATARAAAQEFLVRGLSKTRDRLGVLVFVSLFERRVEVLFDCGIDQASADPVLAEVVKKLDRAVRLDTQPELFAQAVEALGAALGRAHPRLQDDINELADEPLLPEEPEDPEDPGEASPSAAAAAKDGSGANAADERAAAEPKEVAS